MLLRCRPSLLLALCLTACGGGDSGTSDSASSTGAPGSTGSADPTGDPTSSETGVTPTTTATTAPDLETTATSIDPDGTSSTGEPPPLANFSFFMTSYRAMQELSGSQEGFGGDLRYGEQGPGAGLRGADKICAAIAEASMPGASAKGWRAFLSATADDMGQPVNAIDRVGPGPWYDRLGRLVAMTPADLANERPANADPAIVDDLPNEDGVPNHQPDPNVDPVDNHDTLTGSNPQGQLTGHTCDDWTSAVGAPEQKPRIGHSWPRSPDSGRHWSSDHEAGGCAPGANLMGMGGPKPGDYSVGAGGGYGAIYCFALTP